MMAVAMVIKPLPGAGFATRAAAWVRGWRVRRLLQRLSGIETVVLQGRVCPVRARPLGVCRELVPALIRCSQRFSAMTLDEALYADLVKALSLGLNVPRADIEGMTVSLFELMPVVVKIAEVNGLPMMEAGGSGTGEFLQALTTLTGTATAPSSSAPPDGRGRMSMTS